MFVICQQMFSLSVIVAMTFAPLYAIRRCEVTIIPELCHFDISIGLLFVWQTQKKRSHHYSSLCHSNINIRFVLVHKMCHEKTVFKHLVLVNRRLSDSGYSTLKFYFSLHLHCAYKHLFCYFQNKHLFWDLFQIL